MNIKIVSGMAGSGKSTYCKKLEDNGYHYIAHDKWVKQEYADLASGAYDFVNGLVGDKVIIDDDCRNIDFKKLGDMLFADDDLNYIFIDYFTSNFASYINWQIAWAKRTGINFVIEIPYLNRSINWLQRQHSEIEIIYVKTSDEEQHERLIKRGWSEERINKSCQLYFDMLRSYKGYITETIKN